MENVVRNNKNSAETVTISRAEYDTLKAQNAELSQQVDWLMEQIRLVRQKHFGSSSEQSKYDIGEQLSLLFNEAEVFADEKIADPELTEIEKHYRKKSAELKDRLPPDLPIETVEHRLSEEELVCPQCGEQIREIGKEIHRRLKIVPAQVSIIEDIVYTYACRNCEKNVITVPIIKAPVPNPVIKGSFASPEAVAHIMTQKFVMGSPLYRQEQEFKRAGIELSRQTLSNWLLKCSEDWLESVYEELHRRICSHKVIHADETTLQVLREPGKTAQSKSYMWLYRTSGDAEHPIVLYEYQPDRKAIRPAEFLNGFSGFLHADGYSGYHNLPENITVVGCWAHARRKFDEALKAIPEKEREGSLALRGKQYCDRLFAIDKKLAECTPEQRYSKRQELARPVLDEFSAWLSSLKPAPKSGIGKAVYYTQEQWLWLKRYLMDGRLEISNNRAERSIKPFVIDRKNFLFANTPRGAKSSAVIFSIIETAKENDLNPYTYLTYIFKTAPNLELTEYPERISQLLPNSAPDYCKTATAAH